VIGGWAVHDYRLKIKDEEAIKSEIVRLRAMGKRTVFTNGCFDILHLGHTRYLWAARQLGDYLIVGVNSDSSVRAIKGPGRPVQAEEARSEILAALSFVDAVVIFNEETPLRLIESLMPDVLVKGGDWAEDRIVGADAVKGAGGEVRSIPFLKGHSTTAIIQKLKRA